MTKSQSGSAPKAKTRSPKKAPAVPATPSVLSGQYYILVGYDKKPSRVSHTVITASRAALIEKSTYKSAARRKNESVGQIVELLQAYRKLSGYSIVGNEAASELKVFHAAKLSMSLERETGKSIELVKDAPKHSLYISKSLDIKDINRSIEKFWHAQRSGYAVNNAIFVGMVSMFDELIAKLIRESLRAVPDLINSFSMEIPYRDIVAAGDFDELKKNIIENTVQSLMWKGRSEQLKWIEKNITKNDFSAVIPAYKEFIEVAERRNLYVHNDGIATKEYYDRLASFGIKIEKREVGKRLRLNQSYFLSAADALIEAYVVISQCVIRKIKRSAPEDVRDTIDGQFSEAGYYQLANDRCESAARISKTVLSPEHAVADLFQKMSTVNMAIALKKCGDDAECRKILTSADWSSAKDEFKLCIASINEDMDSLERLIPKLKSSDWVSPSVYFEWPAFEWVRSKPRFWELLEEVYGEEIRRVADSDVADSIVLSDELESEPA